MLEKEEKMLNYIMQNCEMGIESLQKLMKCVKDSDMLNEITEENVAYNNVYDKAKEYIKKINGEVKPSCIMQKISADIGVKFNVMLDNSASHVAEMLIQGTTMGMINLIKLQHSNADGNEEILQIADELLAFQINRIEKLKKFL